VIHSTAVSARLASGEARKEILNNGSSGNRVGDFHLESFFFPAF
jgi:hypothetical protein